MQLIATGFYAVRHIFKLKTTGNWLQLQPQPKVRLQVVQSVQSRFFFQSSNWTWKHYPQVALDQWANDSDDTIQNLVTLANVVAPPVEPLHLSFVPSVVPTCTTLLIARSLSATNVKSSNLAITQSIVLKSHLPSITMRSTTSIIFQIEVASILRRGSCYDRFHVHVVCTRFSFLSFLFPF